MLCISRFFCEVKSHPKNINLKLDTCPKSFFLRDMTLLYSEKNDFTIEELLYLFPIDIWIKEFLKELEIEKMENYPTEKRYDNLSKEDRELGFDFVNPP